MLRNAALQLLRLPRPRRRNLRLDARVAERRREGYAQARFTSPGASPMGAINENGIARVRPGAHGQQEGRIVDAARDRPHVRQRRRGARRPDRNAREVGLDADRARSATMAP